jgi:hypothetical protein
VAYGGTSCTGLVTLAGGGSEWACSGNLSVGVGTTPDATLAFVLDETGAGQVTVGGTMTIDADAKLEVDLSGYNWEQGTEFVLVDCGTLNTAFAEGNISVTGLNGGTITQDEGDNNQIVLTVNGPQGTVVSIK